MRRTVIVLKKEYREIRQSTAFRILLIIAAAVTLAASGGISIALNLQSWLGDATATPLLGLFVSLVLYFLPLFIIIAFISVFGSLPVTREKVNGGIECLMATPLTPHALWLGKSLAIFLPAYGVSIAATMIVALILNLAAIVPTAGHFVLPVPALVLGLTVNPLLFFGLLLFMILLELANNPDLALTPLFLIGFGLMIGAPVGLMTGVIDFTSWSFVLWYLAAAVVALSIVLALTRRLTTQNIVLSNKGS
jgi:hypothetical protein